MPPLQYWTHSAALYVGVALFVFNTVFGFTGIHKAISKKWIYILLLVVALALTFFVGLTIAQQEQQNSKEKLNNITLTEDLHKIELQNLELKKNLKEIANLINLNSNLSVKELTQGILKKLNPREIDSRVSEKIIGELKTAGHQKVTIFISNDAEPVQYANQFINILRLAGWNVKGPEYLLIPVTGLHIEVKYSDFIPQSVQLLGNVLMKHSISISPTLGVKPDIESDSFNFIIGSKPLN